MNCFHYFRTKNKLESLKRVCENKDFCNLVMPSENTKTLKFNQYQKYDNPLDKNTSWSSPYGPVCNTKERSLLTSWRRTLQTSSKRWNMTSLGHRNGTSWVLYGPSCYAKGHALPRSWGRLLQMLWGRPHII